MEQNSQGALIVCRGQRPLGRSWIRREIPLEHPAAKPCTQLVFLESLQTADTSLLFRVWSKRGQPTASIEIRFVCHAVAAVESNQ